MVGFQIGKVKTFKYLGSQLTCQNSINEEIKCTLEAGNSCYYSIQTLLSSWFAGLGGLVVTCSPRDPRFKPG